MQLKRLHEKISSLSFESLTDCNLLLIYFLHKNQPHIAIAKKWVQARIKILILIRIEIPIRLISLTREHFWSTIFTAIYPQQRDKEREA